MPMPAAPPQKRVRRPQRGQALECALTRPLPILKRIERVERYRLTFVQIEAAHRACDAQRAHAWCINGKRVPITICVVNSRSRERVVFRAQASVRSVSDCNACFESASSCGWIVDECLGRFDWIVRSFERIGRRG